MPMGGRGGREGREGRKGCERVLKNFFIDGKIFDRKEGNGHGKKIRKEGKEGRKG